MRPKTTASRPEHWRTRVRLICKPQVVYRALLAAGVVGALLVLLNQGDLLWSGQVTRRVLVKIPPEAYHSVLRHYVGRLPQYRQRRAC
jgi:hypothetical protein